MEAIENLDGIDKISNRSMIKSNVDLAKYVNEYTIASASTSNNILENIDEINELLQEEQNENIHADESSQDIMHRIPSQHYINNEFTNFIDDNKSDISCNSKRSISSEKIKKMFNEDYNTIKDHYDDDKYFLLYEIDEIQDQLITEGIYSEKKYNVNINTPLNQLKDIHNILKIKYDKTRYITMGVKAIECIAYVMEMIFDGQRKIGSFDFDLTGWHRSAKQKALSVRTDLGTCFENTVSNYMSPLSRIVFELFASALIYGSSNAKRKKNINNSYEGISSFIKGKNGMNVI